MKKENNKNHRFIVLGSFWEEMAHANVMASSPDEALTKWKAAIYALPSWQRENPGRQPDNFNTSIVNIDDGMNAHMIEFWHHAGYASYCGRYPSDWYAGL